MRIETKPIRFEKVRPISIRGLEGLFIVGPVYQQVIMTNGARLTCEFFQGKRRNCRINGRFASAAQYEIISRG